MFYHSINRSIQRRDLLRRIQCPVSTTSIPSGAVQVDDPTKRRGRSYAAPMRIVATESDGQAEQLIAVAAHTRAQLDELAHPEAERY